MAGTHSIVRGAILWKDPLIIYTTQIEASTSVINVLGDRLIDRRVIMLPLTAWANEESNIARNTANLVSDYLRAHKNHSICIMSNTRLEVETLSSLGVNAFFMNHNTFVDPSIYYPMSLDKKYAAVYTAQLEPFKRHHLCSALPNVALIYHSYSLAKQDYVRDLKSILPRARFINEERAIPPNAGLSKEMVAVALNESECGLCLSAAEGAMHASMEYLLSGLPVVSTFNKGGRDFYLDEEFCRFVAPDPDAVAGAVRELSGSGFTPGYIRWKTMEKRRQEIARFCTFIDGLLGSEGVRADISATWDEIYKDKLLGWEDADSFMARLD